MTERNITSYCAIWNDRTQYNIILCNTKQHHKIGTNKLLYKSVSLSLQNQIGKKWFSKRVKQEEKHAVANWNMERLFVVQKKNMIAYMIKTFLGNILTKSSSPHVFYKNVFYKKGVLKNSAKFHGRRVREGGSLGALDHPPPPHTHTHPSSPFGGALPLLHIRKTFLMRLLYCFWNNYRWISSINGYSNVINKSKNIVKTKVKTFSMKELYRECCEIAKKISKKSKICLLTKNIW